MANAPKQPVRTTKDQAEFLGMVFQLLRRQNIVSDEEFIAVFPPHVIMQSVNGFHEDDVVEDNKYLQSCILVNACGQNEKVASRYSTDIATSILEEHIAEGIATPEKIRGSLSFPQWARALESPPLYQLVFGERSHDWRFSYFREGQAIKTDPRYGITLEVLTAISTLSLLSLADKQKALGEDLEGYLPPKILRKLAKLARNYSQTRTIMDQERYFRIVTDRVLVDSVPPQILYLVVHEMARQNGFVDMTAAPTWSKALPPPADEDDDQANTSGADNGEASSGTPPDAHSDDEQLASASAGV
jgi:hypothetical protein